MKMVECEVRRIQKDKLKKNLFPLSKQWLELFYPELENRFHYPRALDERARDELREFFVSRKIVRSGLDKLLPTLRNKAVFVFGAGPSLVSDINSTIELILKKFRYPVVAADGASEALLAAGVKPSVCVSDLDSASPSTLISISRDDWLVIHAHGDNIEKIRKHVPRFGNRIFGTTQVEEREPIVNTGGFTDGDRACYLVSAFEPRTIVLGGMDFGGREGDYSRNRDGKSRAHERELDEKLELGLRSMEYLIANSPKTKFLNLTAEGVKISGAKKISKEELIQELS